jgi:hypothetical protein
MIKNKTKNTILTKNYQKLSGIWEKSIGLIGKNQSQTVILTTRFGIHTFGLKYPIDVLILNKNLKVTRLKPNLKPRRIFVWNPKDNLVIELEKNAIVKSNTSVGDVLEIS